MTWNVLKLFAILCFLQVSSSVLAEKHADGTASLTGLVKGGSGTAVALHLEPTTMSPVRAFDGYEAVLKEDGTFLFTEIPPGEYRLTVESSGPIPRIPSLAPSNFTVILPPAVPSGTITMHPGEARKGLSIELTHKLSFCGHVTRDAAPKDAYGRDIGPPQIVPADTSINFLHFNPEFGVLDNETKIDTDKDGSFRVTDLAPGTYYVRSFETWYPSEGSFAQANAVVVGAEPATACNVDIQQRLNNSCYTGEVFGEIQSDPSIDKNSYGIAVLNHNTAGVSVAGTYGERVPGRKLDTSAAGGSFLYQLCAGDYDFVLSDQHHAGNNLWGAVPTQKIVFDTQHVTIAPGAAAHILLTPHPKPSIEGEILLDQITREEFCPNCQAIYVSILREGNGEFQTVTLSSGNHFDFRNVSPGEYQIFVTANRLDKVLLQSIVVNGVAGKGNHFTVPDAKSASMAVTLSGDLTQAQNHASPDVRHDQRWQTEGMRPLASVAGRVEGAPDASYTVRLLPIASNPSAEAILTTRTAPDGSFHFESVPPGIYHLRVHDRDYIRSDYGSRAAEQRGEPLLISPGAAIKNLTLTAPKRRSTSSICGHLTDTNGNARTMQIWHRSVSDFIQYTQSQAISTDSSGYFRIDGLEVGDYLLATPDLGRVVTLSGDGQLYEATPIHVEENKNAGCGINRPIELHFPANGGSMHFISGSVVGDLPPRLGDRFLVELDDAAPFMTNSTLRAGKLDADHKFKLENVPDGRYILNVYGVYGPEPQPNSNSGIVTLSVSAPYYEPLRHLIATQQVFVTDHDIADLALTPLTLPSVTGLVHIPHPPADWKEFKPDSLVVRLIPHRKNGTLIATLKGTGEDLGEFTIAAADPGEYEIQFEGSDPRRVTNNVLYIASLKLDGKEVNPRFFHLPKDGVAKLDVELGAEMASLHAQVLPDKSFRLPIEPLNQRCVGTGHYSVALFPYPIAGPDAVNEPNQTLHLETAWSLGSYCNGVASGVQQFWDGRILAIPPGKYYAIAATNILWQFGMGQVPLTEKQLHLLEGLAAIATPVTLHPGENLELNLVDKTIEVSRIAARVGMDDEPEYLRQKNRSCCNR